MKHHEAARGPKQWSPCESPCGYCDQTTCEIAGVCAWKGCAQQASQPAEADRTEHSQQEATT